MQRHTREEFVERAGRHDRAAQVHDITVLIDHAFEREADGRTDRPRFAQSQHPGMKLERRVQALEMRGPRSAADC